MKRLLTPLLTALLLFVAATAFAASGKGVVLNFTDVDISTMVKFISDLTGKNFVMDDRVKGKISVYSPAKLSADDAFNVFTSVLELKGFTVIQSGKVYKIVPVSAAKQSGMKILTDRDRAPVNESYIARVITLDNIPAADAVTFLQPVVSKDGYISSFGPGNMLLVVDSALNLQKVQSILDLIDTDQRREGGELVYLKNASAESAATVVREWLGSRDKSQQKGGQGSGISSGVGGLIIPDTRLNALLVFGSEKDKEDVKKLIALIDVVPPTSSSKVNVYYLENADATEVAKVLEGVVKGSSTTTAAPAQQGAAPATQQSPFDSGRISITADKGTNSLVVMASPNDYQNLVQVIQKLDRRRRQVFVQAVIAEVSLSKLKQLGVQLGAGGGGMMGSVAGAGLFDPFNFMGTGGQLSTLVTLLKAVNSNAALTGNLNALDSNGVVNVLSTPNVLTSDNKEAEIFVGENVPFKGKIDISNTTSTPSYQSVDRKDTGITLKLTPQISEGDYIRLDLYQEISALKDTTDPSLADVITTKRSAKTAVVVKDGETVVIGGLIQDKDTVQVNKVWLLGDIPVLGWLFKYKSVQHDKTNLMILLTPRILRDARDLTAVTDEQRKRFDDANRTIDGAAPTVVLPK